MQQFGNIIKTLSACLVALVFSGTGARAVTIVEAGNVHVEQPDIPRASAKRTKALKTTYERKYEKVVDLLRSDQTLLEDIKDTASRFEIDPIHMIGAIVGEHTYNVDALDRAQTYYVKALSYISNDIAFEHDGESVDKFIQRPQFSACEELDGSLAIWTCREAVWETAFRGKTIDGQSFPDDRFSAVFFQPFYAGQTFGLGQLNPLTALKMTDRVSEVTGASKLDHRDGKALYSAIIDPEQTLPYIAATLATAIEAYKTIAGFDISTNPGLTATLYNTGNSVSRAEALLEKNGGKGGPTLPQENYYGWLINERESELRDLL